MIRLLILLKPRRMRRAQALNKTHQVGYCEAFLSPRKIRYLTGRRRERCMFGFTFWGSPDREYSYDEALRDYSSSHSTHWDGRGWPALVFLRFANDDGGCVNTHPASCISLRPRHHKTGISAWDHSTRKDFRRCVKPDGIRKFIKRMEAHTSEGIWRSPQSARTPNVR